MEEAVRQAAAILRAAHKAVAFTGAGFSTPSGIPDFRSAGSGLWTRYLPMEVASLSTFRYEPEKFFAWLHPLASHMLSAQPNPAHRSLAELEQAGYLDAIITQNIDALHQRAGSQRVYEVHGTLNTLTCVGCFSTFSSQGIIEAYIEDGAIPHCPQCGALLKPDVILFEEQLPIRTWNLAQDAANSCDAMLVAGTSLEVLPSAKLPLMAVENGAHLIMVNKTSTYIDERAEVLLTGNVADIIPQITAEVING